MKYFTFSKQLIKTHQKKKERCMTRKQHKIMKSKNDETTMINRKQSSSSEIQRLSKTLCSCMIGNFILICLDSHIDESNGDYQHSINRLQSITNTVETLTDSGQCFLII
jgi:hypothetical protein